MSLETYFPKTAAVLFISFHPDGCPDDLVKVIAYFDKYNGDLNNKDYKAAFPYRELYSTFEGKKSSNNYKSPALFMGNSHEILKFGTKPRDKPSENPFAKINNACGLRLDWAIVHRAEHSKVGSLVGAANLWMDVGEKMDAKSQEKGYISLPIYHVGHLSEFNFFSGTSGFKSRIDYIATLGNSPTTGNPAWG